MSKLSHEDKEILRNITLPENQGGDPTPNDYFWYTSLGIIFPIILLIWGWL